MIPKKAMIDFEIKKKGFTVGLDFARSANPCLSEKKKAPSV